MKYTGELYGKVAAGYVPLEHTSEQFDRMYQTLKEVQTDINIVGQVSHATLKKIISILKELKS